MTDDLADQYKKERKEQRSSLANRKIAVSVYLPVKIVKMIDTVCDIDGQSRANFMRYAITSAVKKWKPPTDNKNAWPPCRHCGTRHDPSVHGLDEY
jgi:hypothetical protein